MSGVTLNQRGRAIVFGLAVVLAFHATTACDGHGTGSRSTSAKTGETPAAQRQNSLEEPSAAPSVSPPAAPVLPQEAVELIEQYVRAHHGQFAGECSTATRNWCYLPIEVEDSRIRVVVGRAQTGLPTSSVVLERSGEWAITMIRENEGRE